MQGSWAVSRGVTARGLAGPSPGDHQLAVMLTAMSPRKMVIAGGPHPGADIAHPFQRREPKLLLLSFLFRCQLIHPITGEKGTPHVPTWHVVFGKRSLITGIFDCLAVFKPLFWQALPSRTVLLLVRGSESHSKAEIWAEHVSTGEFVVV